MATTHTAACRTYGMGRLPSSFTRRGEGELEETTKAYACSKLRPHRGRVLESSPPSSWLSLDLCRRVPRGIRCGSLCRAGQGNGAWGGFNVGQSTLFGHRGQGVPLHLHSVFQTRQGPGFISVPACQKDVHKQRKKGAIWTSSTGIPPATSMRSGSQVQQEKL